MTDFEEATELWEAKYSADQLRDLLKKGHATKNDNGEPSYPIADEEDLRKAIQAVGRGGGSHDAIRRHIIKRAKALGKSDMIPDNWTSKGAKESLTESTTLAEATRGHQPTGRRMRIKLIDSGWGSSGYYSPQVLAEAAKAGAFSAGCHMYIDHPTTTEQVERPERSVRDLAGVFTSDASYTDGALYAEAQVFAPYQQLLAEKADAIGVSIRASGTAEQGEAEGRTGMIVTALTEGTSVDFVTKAGRGGEIVQLLESARELGEARNIGQWLEARLHLAFTQLTDGMYGDGRLTREERIGLSSAVGDALGAFVQRVEADHPQLYQRDLWDGPDSDSDMSESKPAPPAQPIQEGAPMSGGTNQQGSPPDGGASTNKPADVREAETQVQQLERQLAEARAQLERRSDHAVRLTEAEREVTRLTAENARFRALESVRSTVTAALAESGLPETAWPRVTATVVGHEGSAIPLTEGKVDDAKLKTRIEDAVKDMRAFVAGLAEAHGYGQVRGMGPSSSGDDLSESDFEAGLAGVFESIGLPNDQAKLAAKGR